MESTSTARLPEERREEVVLQHLILTLNLIHQARPQLQSHRHCLMLSWNLVSRGRLKYATSHRGWKSLVPGHKHDKSWIRSASWLSTTWIRVRLRNDRAILRVVVCRAFPRRNNYCHFDMNVLPPQYGSCFRMLSHGVPRWLIDVPL
jgi:hypothetical protein